MITKTIIEGKQLKYAYKAVIFSNIRSNVTKTQHWQQRIGNQRDWVWRGWQTRYSYIIKSQQKSSFTTPLILIHGFGACIEHWRNNLPLLSQNHPIYAIDLLGFGASRKAATEYTVDLWVEQVYDFWQTFIRQPVVLVGNSIGSLVCMTAAATYPDMVKGIVMLSLPDVSLRQEMIPKLILPIVTTLENLVASPPLLKALFQLLKKPQTIRQWAKVAYEDENAVNDELIEIITAPAQDEGAANTFCALFASVRKPAFAPAAKAILPDLQIPMLLIWGRQDRMVPFNLASTFASLNDRIELVELDGVGHCPHDECPDRFNSIVLSWLQTNFPNSEFPSC